MRRAFYEGPLGVPHYGGHKAKPRSTNVVCLLKHSLCEYVCADATTNRIEGAFGHFKRAITGVYHKTSDENVHRYLTMFAWRWNRRKIGEGERVDALLKGAKNRRITYKQLIGKD